MTYPKVSICIPAYKQVEYLQKTLESIQNQIFQDYEIILTDDSPDDSIKRLAEKFDFHGKLKYYKNPKTLGSPENWNEAIRHATGEYIKILHHDDWFADENSLGKFVKMLDENPNADFAFSSSKIYDQYELKHIHTPTEKQLSILRTNPEYLFYCNFIGAPSAVIYRNDQTKNFDKNLQWLVDIDFYISYLKTNSKFIFCKKPLVVTTMNPNRISNKCQNDKCIEFKEYFYLYQKIKHRRINAWLYFKIFFRLIGRYKINSINDIMNCGLLNRPPWQVKIIIMVRKILRNKLTFKIFNIIENVKHYFSQRKEVTLWYKNGKPIPPPHLIKRKIVREYSEKFNLNIFIETGTYLGEMIGAMRRKFKKIYSIELDPILCDRAKKNFSKFRHIAIYCGDSSTVLPKILSKQTTPCLFWLDAHYSAGITARGEIDTPIIKELCQILDHPIKEHVILIDDARCFIGENNYPTIEKVSKLVSSKCHNLVTYVENDIIRIHKK